MNPKLERLSINCSAEKLAAYIDRFYFWIDTRTKSDEKAIKGVFLSAVGKKTFTLLRTLENTKTLTDSVTRQTSSVRNGRTGEVSYTGQITETSKCNFEELLDS